MNQLLNMMRRTSGQRIKIPHINFVKAVMASGRGSATAGVAKIPSVLRNTSRIIKNSL